MPWTTTEQPFPSARFGSLQPLSGPVVEEYFTTGQATKAGGKRNEGIEQKIAKFAKSEDQVPLRYLCVLLFKFPFRFLSKPPRGKSPQGQTPFTHWMVLRLSRAAH